MKLYLPIILGTAHQDNKTALAAQFVFEQAKKQDFETELLKVADFVDSPVTGGMSEPNGARWSDIVTKADGLIIVTPEYNNGYPGELKLMIDQIYKEYANKAVAICGVSSGGMGGSRAVKQLVMVAHTLKLHPIRNALYFPNVGELFNESGVVQDEAYIERAQTMFDELIWLAAALKAAR